MWNSLFNLLHNSVIWLLKDRFSSRVMPRNLLCVDLLIFWPRNSILSGKLWIIFLFDLKIVNEDLSAFRVNLLALSHVFSWVIIFLPVAIMSVILFLWKKIVVSSANSLTFPSGQHLYKSFMKSMKNKGPRTEPCGTPHVMGLSFDLEFSSCTFCLRLLK